MAWSKLADRLDKLPSVIAGPLLRRVSPKSVTVWVALRTSAQVTLIVQDDNENQIMQGSRATTAIGERLHIVAVTAVADASLLTEGVIYQYNLTFKFNGLSKTLAAATDNAELAYAPFSLPSFALPPKDLNRVRLIHGSCRMPHGYGKDNLPLLDDLIAQTAENALDRPHQLLLLGDQIYADDVPDALLLLLTDAADQLLGWKEVLPIPKKYGGPSTASQLSPYLRNRTQDQNPNWANTDAKRPGLLAHAGFTSDDLKSHLMSLGEYLSMYLFVWSEVLWPPSLPSFADLLASVQANVAEELFSRWEEFLDTKKKKKGIASSTDSVEEFRTTLPGIRRILANIPSYMIMDDHEVTDDWNMTLKFCSGVYDNPLGIRVVQNALVAYALCQHWGNAPEQFAALGPTAIGVPAGFTLLQLLDGGTASTYEHNSSRLQTIVGVHDFDTLKNQPDTGCFHDQNQWLTIDGRPIGIDSLTYNFTIEMDAYQVIFTDTRTWRSYPQADDPASALLPGNQLKAQILDTLPTGDRALLVVFSTNAPAVVPIRTATEHPGLVGENEDIYEAWDLPSVHFDRLLTTLTDKLPLDNTKRRYGPVILLSGDVHHSFASRLIYRANTRFEDQQPQPATAVFAQLVSSSFKRQNDKTLGLHRDGYTYAPTGAGWILPDPGPEGYVGWNVPFGSGKNVGVMFAAAGLTAGSAELDLDQPTVRCSWARGGALTSIELSVTPDYRYRLDYLVASTEGVQPSTLDPIPPIPSGATAAERKKAADAFHKATGHYRDYNNSAASTRQIVGLNNIGELTFEWGAGDNKKVHHSLRWWDPSKPKVQWTTYTVPLDPNDANFPDIKAAKEP
jgi:hypothetical protein